MICICEDPSGGLLYCLRLVNLKKAMAQSMTYIRHRDSAVVNVATTITSAARQTWIEKFIR